MKRQVVRNRTAKLYHQQDGACYYCNSVKMYLRQDVTKKFFNANRHLAATFDHIVPQAAGGKNGISNGVCCCAYCNNRKGDQEFGEFIENYDVAFARSVLVIFESGDTKHKITTSRKNEKIRLYNIETRKQNVLMLAWYALCRQIQVIDLALQLDVEYEACKSQVNSSE